MHNRFFKNDKEKEYYFKAVVKRMNIKDKEKWDEINEHELSLMEVLYDNFCDKSSFRFPCFPLLRFYILVLKSTFSSFLYQA